MEITQTIYILPTALIRIRIGDWQSEPLRALCDFGSQPNLITHSVVKSNALDTTHANLVITGISNDFVKINRKVSIEISPWFNSDVSIKLDLLVIPKDSKWDLRLPDRDLRASEFKISHMRSLADPKFWKRREIALLLGVGAWAKIVKSGVDSVGEELTRQETTLGPVIFGRAGCDDTNNAITRTFAIKECDYKGLEKLLKRLWEVDQVPMRCEKTKEQQLVEKIYKEKRVIDSQGKFSVPIILQPNTTHFGDSRTRALNRFLQLERRFERDHKLKEGYIKFMKEYEILGHMREVTPFSDSNGLVFYIPHHAICSNEKIKVVFDCSMKTNLGISLNDMQLKGQKLQRDLYDILLRARRFKIGIAVDVEKMYRQIRIIPEHSDLQRIFWRSNPKDEIREYCLTTVIYGQTSSPVTAIMVMQEGASKLKEKYPRAAEFIKEDFYMDDGFSGANDENDAIKLVNDLTIIFNSMGLPLNKWKSNSQQLMNYVKGDDKFIFFEDPDKESEETQTILGMKWNLESDVFTYLVKNDELPNKWTKRTVLSKVASIYDPLGHLAPVTLMARNFVQELWRSNKLWDEKVDDNFEKRWCIFWHQIKAIVNVKIPRWINLEDKTDLSFHCFSDASEKGIGVVIYMRAESKNCVKITQLTAKSRVAPLKIVAIPKLELVAATLATKMMTHVRKTMELEHIPYFMRTDSEITLLWLKKEPAELRMFVGNRIAYIQENSDIKRWSHVKSSDNPADIASRGLFPTQIAREKFWWEGPEWLKLPQQNWPIRSTSFSDEIKINYNNELKVHLGKIVNNPLKITVEKEKNLSLLEYSNNLDKLLRIYSYIMRFKNGFAKENLKKRETRVTRLNRVRPNLVILPSIEEKAQAMRYFIKYQQQLDFAKEIIGETKGSKLEPLLPFLDENGILRMGGRLRHAKYPFDMKHPIIIPPKTRLSWLIIKDAHEKLDHGHIQVMMQYVRSQYWIPQMRREMRTFVNKCVVCQRYEHPLQSQLMGDLPEYRVTPCKPFTYAGVDYAGPIEIKEYFRIGPKRQRSRKAWIAIFVCLNTRAIHIDIVLDLTSAAFIECFQRFVSRRGRCIKMISDNATTYVGAEKEIREALKAWDITETHERLNSFGTSWEFMTSGAPHQGGIYESSVKAAKYHMRRIMGSKSYTYDQTLTFLLQIEAILNSRPLYAISDDPNDIQAITPGHLMFGEPVIMPTSINPPKQTKASVTQIWREQKDMRQRFWEQWVKDYLPTLQRRGKWQRKNEKIELDKIVIIKDENLAPAHWLLGKIIELKKGKDDLVRSVKIKTKSSELWRPIQKICVLPVETV